jgi:Glycosyltransferase 61
MTDTDKRNTNIRESTQAVSYQKLPDEVSTEVSGPSAPNEPHHGCSAEELRQCKTVNCLLTDDLTVKIFTIPNATLIGERYPLAFADPPSSSTALWESHLIPSCFDFDYNNVRTFEDKSDLQKAVNIDRPVIFLAGPASDNFYHWMHDCLPRLLAAKHAGIDFPVLIPPDSDKNRFIRESLNLLSIPKDQIIEYPGGKVSVPAVVLVEDLFHVNPDQVHHFLLNEIREHLLNAANVRNHNAPSPDRIFLSREGTGTTRTLVDQGAVETILTERGFTKVRTEDMPLREQIRLFANARRIVAPHGAGLFHSLFMMSQGHCIELFPMHPEVSSFPDIIHYNSFDNSPPTDVQPYPAKKLVDPCWFRILGAHREQGRNISWTQVNSAVEMLSDTDFSQYRLRLDQNSLRQALNTSFSR